MFFAYLDVMDGRSFQDHTPFRIPVLTSEQSIEMICYDTWHFLSALEFSRENAWIFSVLISVMRFCLYSYYLHGVYCSTISSYYYNVPDRLSYEKLNNILCVMLKPSLYIISTLTLNLKSNTFIYNNSDT